MELEIFYDSDTDTLSLWNGKPAGEGADVADNLTVDLDAEGEVVGFTLEHASAILRTVAARPFLLGNPPESFTLADNESPPEILKAVSERPFLVWNPEDLTIEDIEKLGIRSIVWIRHRE